MALIVGSAVPPAPAALLVQSTGRRGLAIGEGKGGRRQKDREGIGGGRSKDNGENEEWSRNKLLHAFNVPLILYKDYGKKQIIRKRNYSDLQNSLV